MIAEIEVNDDKIGSLDLRSQFSTNCCPLLVRLDSLSSAIHDGTGGGPTKQSVPQYAARHPPSSILYLYPRLAYSAAIWGPFSATERFISSTRMTRNAATFKGANNSDRPTIVTTRGQTTCIGLISRFISDSQ